MDTFGHLTVFTGPMFSDKTTNLITLDRNLAQFGGLESLVFYPTRDTRLAVRGVVAPHGEDPEEGGIKAYPVKTAGDILCHPRLKRTPVVMIDEGNFFPLEENPNLVEVVFQLWVAGKRVVVAGLDLDFRRQPFGAMPGVICLASALGGDVFHLRAVCQSCGGLAAFSQRLIDGDSAHYGDEIVVIGAEELYEARCPACHIVRRD